jgi:hypothetical protein
MGLTDIAKEPTDNVSWIEKHWKSIALIVTPIVVGGIVYWAYTGTKKRSNGRDKKKPSPRTTPIDVAVDSTVDSASESPVEPQVEAPVTPVMQKSQSMEETFVATTSQNAEIQHEQDAVTETPDISSLTPEVPFNLHNAIHCRNETSWRRVQRTAETNSTLAKSLKRLLVIPCTLCVFIVQNSTRKLCRITPIPRIKPVPCFTATVQHATRT